VCQPPDRLTLTLSTDPLTAALRRTLAARREQIKAKLDTSDVTTDELRHRRRDVFKALMDSLTSWAASELDELDELYDDDLDGLDDLAPPAVAESVVVTDDDGETD
jgi:DNA anti-recombination protein RmuC